MTVRPRIALVWYGAMMSLVVVAGCSQSGGNGADVELDKKVQRLEELAEKRADRAKELQAMKIEELAAELRKDSEKGREPFNSTSYKELVSRGDKAAVELKPIVADGEKISFLLLLALRQIDEKVYQEVDAALRVTTLVDALKSSKYFNTWGLPHLYWEDAAKAIIEEREAAQGPLRRLFVDQRKAPMWGSDEVVEYENYRYRVCDYAWALSMSISGVKVEIPADPKERDVMISKAQRQEPPKPDDTN